MPRASLVSRLAEVVRGEANERFSPFPYDPYSMNINNSFSQDGYEFKPDCWYVHSVALRLLHHSNRFRQLWVQLP